MMGRFPTIPPFPFHFRPISVPFPSQFHPISVLFPQFPPFTFAVPFHLPPCPFPYHCSPIAPALPSHVPFTGGAAARRGRAGHLFGPLLTLSCNLGFLCGPFPVGDIGDAPFHRFFVEYPDFFFSFLCILDVAYSNCHPFLPVFNHVYPFSISLSSPREGMGNVAILIYPHHWGPREGRGDVVVVRCILPFGKCHHLPKDTAHLEGGTVAPTAPFLLL